MMKKSMIDDNNINDLVVIKSIQNHAYKSNHSTLKKPKNMMKKKKMMMMIMMMST
jgi:hypothetical protein